MSAPTWREQCGAASPSPSSPTPSPSVGRSKTLIQILDIIKYFKIFYVADSSKVGKTMLVTLSFLLIGVFVMMAFTLYYFKKHKVISIHHVFIKISIYCKYF